MTSAAQHSFWTAYENIDPSMEKVSKRRSVSVLKQGFLVRKGRVRHTWKTRWCILHEDRLTYFHKTDRSTPVGCVLLEGASIVSPVPEYDKREAVFKLCKKEGKEYLLQAPNDIERDHWVHAISAVIRSMAVIAGLNSSVTAAEGASSEDGAAQGGRVRGSLRLPRKVDLSEILSAMQDFDAGVRLTSFEIDDVEYTNCFPGTSVIDWLIKWMFVETREHAAKVAEELLRLGHLQPIVAPTKKKTEVKPDLAGGKFYDSSDLFYRFSSLRRTASMEFLDDSGSDSSSSEGEESEDDILDTPASRLGKGAIIKEGFLMKKGHDLRKKWKVRRVVLRDEPLSLEYYSTSKMAKKPLKLVSLDGARVLDLELINNPQDYLLSPATKKKRHLVCVQRPEGRPVLLEAQDEYERVEWMKCLQKLLQPPHSA